MFDHIMSVRVVETKFPTEIFYMNIKA